MAPGTGCKAFDPITGFYVLTMNPNTQKGNGIMLALNFRSSMFIVLQCN